MKGIILAGGKGTRLWPLTEATNKHLAPVGRVPMIEYPFHTLKEIGIDSICVVTGGEHFGDITSYLSRVHPGVPFSFHPQIEAGGIAQALSLTEHYTGGEKLAVILGDNIFEDNFNEDLKNFISGSKIFLKETKEAKRFGVAEIKGEKVINVEEKPKNPKTNYAVTGFYIYDSKVFDIIKRLKPSKRGELEITDVNNHYIKNNEMRFSMVKGFWSDAGTFDSLLKASELIKDLEK